MAKNDKPVGIGAAEYSKRQLLASRRYAHCRDLIGALLAEGKRYTLAAVDALIRDFNERKM